MDVNEQARKKPIPVYEVLPLLAKLSILDMESWFPKFCRHLFVYALERITEFEIDENRRLDKDSQLIGTHLVEAIHSVTDAKHYFEIEREQYLNTWIEAVFKVILPVYKSSLQRFFKHLKSDLSDEQLQIITGLGLFNAHAKKPTKKEKEEIEILRPLCQSSGDAARMVIDAMARMKSDGEASQRALLLWSAMNFPAAALAISIYFEALAFAVQTQEKRKPSDTKWPLLVVYLWRKLGLKKKLPAVEARLRYGKNSDDSGSLYKRALNLFPESNPADQEMAADAYCDTFMNRLNQLPSEALLNPKLAIGYLFKSSRRAASKKLPRQKVELTDPSNSRLVRIFEPPERIALDEHSDSSLKEHKLLPDEIKSLPGYELFRQRIIEKRSLAELGKDQALTGRNRAITKQAVHKRIRRFKKKAEECHKDMPPLKSRSKLKRLSDEEWRQIKPLLPTVDAKSRRGPRRYDDRRIMELILHKLRTGCPWTELPQKSTLYDRYKLWFQAGFVNQMSELGILHKLGISQTF